MGERGGKRARFALGCLSVLAAIGICGTVGARLGGGDYQGRIERDQHTFFGFDVDKVNGHKKVRHVSFYGPVACRSGDRGYLPSEVEGGFRIRHHRFHGTRDLITMGEGTATVKGRLLDGGRAKGTLDVDYRADIQRCYSGVVHWKAKRGATVPLPD